MRKAKRQIAEMKFDTEQTMKRMKLVSLYKVGSKCNLNPWPDCSFA